MVKNKLEVKLQNAALDEQGTEIILRGSLDLNTLDGLKVDTDYQREFMSDTVRRVMRAFIAGETIEDVKLGMRGQRFKESSNGTVTLYDPVYIIDGQQRVAAAIQTIEAGKIPKLGAIVYFDTDQQRERKLFETWGCQQIKISSNVLLRNQRVDVPFVHMLYSLCFDAEFALYRKVQWNQYRHRGELLTATQLLRATVALHAASHMVQEKFSNMSIAGQNAMDRIGRELMRDNVKYLFEIIDEAWGIRSIQVSAPAPQLQANFMNCLTLLLCRYENFWAKDRLLVRPDLSARLKAFPVNDPSIAALIGGSGQQGRKLLMTHMIEHIGRGGRILEDRTPLARARRPVVRPQQAVAAAAAERSV